MYVLYYVEMAARPTHEFNYTKIRYSFVTHTFEIFTWLLGAFHAVF